MQRVKVTHNFQNKKEVPALHESCVQNVKKQPTIALQIFWVKCFSLNYSAQSAQKCMAVNAFGYNESLLIKSQVFFEENFKNPI